MISVQNYRKTYDGFIAVDHLSFEVQPGQVLGLIGPNGAGKTTTLRALCGLVTPTEGHMEICGFPVEENPVEAKKRLCYIPDDPPLFPELTVDQHLAFTASIYGISDYQEQATELLTRFELLDKRNARASDLSRGMRQKLAVSCGYLHNPEVILLDEPMTGLDPLGIRTLKDTIQERAATGTAVVVSSHLLAMVEDICSHVLILKKGQQKYAGSIDELKSQFMSDSDQATLEQVFFQATNLEAEPETVTI